MDSLLASYLSSDEEEEKEEPHQQQEVPKASHIFSSLPQPKSPSVSLSLPPPKSSTTALSSLPQPKSSTTFSSLPQPKPSSSFPSLPQPKFSSGFSSLPQPNSSSIFSSLPPPSSDNPQTLLNPTSSDSKPKRVVQFRPPIVLKPPADEDDDEEEEKQRKPIKEPISSGSSLNSFFSSLPAPKNTLGSGSAPILGAGRRSVVETDIPTVNYNRDELESKGAGFDDHQESHAGNFSNESTPVSTAAEPVSAGSDGSSWNASNENYGSYGYYEDNGNYGGYEVNYENYDGGSTVASTTYMPETSGLIDNMPKMPGKRGRKEIPSDIVEVKQDELMKNRPREDQVKLTGIAFGPSYQPASAKGKPSKLHKRKHQIGSLYYDMRQKEHELAERRSKGFLTKAETQAKYGW